MAIHERESVLLASWNAGKTATHELGEFGVRCLTSVRLDRARPSAPDGEAISDDPLGWWLRMSRWR
jgi:hypothetical protein